MQKSLLRLDLGDDRSGRAKHERLKEHFVGEMLSGRLKPGQVLPSEHHLVETLGVARMTIRQAMASLENEGLIRRVQGKGTFVDSDVRQKLNRGLDLFALVVLETHTGFYPSLLRGFESGASDINHQTIICATDDDVDRQADIVLQLLDKKVGGVALNPTNDKPTPAHQVRQLQERGIPVVFLHRRVEGATAPLLALPYREIGRVAANALVERGHRRLAFITSQPKPSVDACEEGFREALRPANGDISIQHVRVEDAAVNTQEQEQSVWAALQEMFSKPNPPTAIFATFDSLAEVIYLMLPRLGLRAPEDVSLLGFGGASRDGAFLRRLTSVVVDEVATGRLAVSLLHEMRDGKRPIDDNTEIVLELDISEGETLAAPKERMP
jgi:GntR family transcriptional regulator, arabinose operon transcriptional repressor